MKILALSLLMALGVLTTVQGGRKCTNPKGNDGESYTEGCLKMTCKAGVYRSSIDHSLCCYNGQPYVPNTTITAREDGCAMAILNCKQEDDVATAFLQVENNCGEHSTEEQVQEIKHLLVKLIEQTDCDTDSPESASLSSTTTNSTHGTEGFHTLLLGGETSDTSYSTNLEVITPNMVCTPEMPPLPVPMYAASSVLLGSKIFYCAGYNGGYHATCHSYHLGQGTNTWEQEPSMNYAREYFAMSVIGNTIYASGGKGDSRSYHTTIESYTQEDGWKLEESMTMSAHRCRHCSAVLGTRLVVIGGSIGSSFPSNSVQEFETTSGTWVSVQHMIAARYNHACQVGVFEGQAGIFVSGGRDTRSTLKSVEFYVAAEDQWRSLGSMRTARAYHSMTILNTKMIVAGGYNGVPLASMETLNKTNWIASNNMKIGRDSHAAVSFPVGLLTCKTD